MDNEIKLFVIDVDYPVNVRPAAAKEIYQKTL